MIRSYSAKKSMRSVGKDWKMSISGNGLAQEAKRSEIREIITSILDLLGFPRRQSAIALSTVTHIMDYSEQACLASLEYLSPDL